MKNILIVVLFVLSLLVSCRLSAQSPKYHPFRLDGAIGVSMHPAVGNHALLLALAPSYQLNEQCLLTLTYERTKQQQHLIKNSFFSTVDYALPKFKNTNTNLFFGTGIGLTWFRNTLNNHLDNYVCPASMFRVGVDDDHARISVEYKCLGNRQNWRSCSYVALKLNFYILRITKK